MAASRACVSPASPRSATPTFATVDGTDRTLWELTDPTLIPTLPASVMFNVWHPAEHWFDGGSSAPPDYPAQDATLLVDWVRYWED